MGDQGKPPSALQPVPNQENGKGLLACGCDPTLLGDKAVLRKINPNMFDPGMGMMLEQCGQCKEILGFQLVRSISKQSLITKPTGLM